MSDPDKFSDIFEAYVERGDKSCWVKLHQEFFGTVLFENALRWTRNKEMAEELVQETQMKVLINRNQYRKGSSFPAWANRIMFNLFLDLNKKSRSRHVHDDSGLEEIPSFTSSPEDDMVMKDLKEIIGHELSKLTEKEKDAIHLRHVEELSFKDISSKIGTSEFNAKQILYRALCKIRTAFQSLEL